MHDIFPGETWTLLIDGEPRTVDVMDAGAAPGWWKCRDRETGLQFIAREHWFVAPVKTDEQ